MVQNHHWEEREDKDSSQTFRPKTVKEGEETLCVLGSFWQFTIYFLKNRHCHTMSPMESNELE